MSAIPEQDLVAVRAYISSFHGEVDRALREGDGPKLQQLDALIRVATVGLLQLPPFRGPVYRAAALPAAAAARYTPGLIIQEPSFVSASADPVRHFPGDVQYVIQSFNGRLVRALADDPAELEVVFFTRTRFKVLAVDAEGGAARCCVYLAELPDARLMPRQG